MSEVALASGSEREEEGGARKVLVVDRERFSDLICKMLSDRYQTTSAADGLGAILRLRESLADAMVVEVSIPGNGIRLSELMGLSPQFSHIPTILTSANSSVDMVLRAREAGASSYLVKPFRPSDLIKRIEEALTEFSVIGAISQEMTGGMSGGTSATGETRRSIQERVKKISGLPVFPATHAEILKLAKSENANSEALAEQIKMDPSLLATVLKLTNSAYYGLRKKVVSLKVAVSLLGFEEIANLVMSAQVFQNLSGYKSKQGLDLKAFWRHSVGTGVIARSLARKMHAEKESPFLAGILHNIGKIVLDRFFTDYYAQVVALVQRGDVSISQAEGEVLGLTHAEVGGQLAQEWRFSEDLLNCILYHHALENVRRYQRLVDLVHLADVICRMLEFGSGGDALIPQVDPEVMDRFALTESGLQMLAEAAKEDLANAESFLMALG